MKIDGVIKKVLWWRLISILITVVAIYAVTGDIMSATGITIYLHALLTVSHYIFEKTWEKLHEGR